MSANGLPECVFITGASAGFGEELARQFVAGGARVVATARRLDRLSALAHELGADRLLPLALDVRDRAAVERAVAELPPAFSAVDCVVNNAGLALGLEPAPSADLENWDAMIDTNCRGLVYVTRALLPGMVSRATRATSSISAPSPGRILIPAATSTARPRRSSISSVSTCAAICTGRACG